MSSKLRIVLTMVGIVGASAAGGAVAEPYHGTREASNYDAYDAANVSPDVGHAAFGGAYDSGYESGPRYHGGPKSSW